MKDFTKRYCVQLLFENISPLYSEIRYDHDPYFFDTETEAERFKQQQRQLGLMTTDVMELENLPF